MKTLTDLKSSLEERYGLRYFFYIEGADIFTEKEYYQLLITHKYKNVEFIVTIENDVVITKANVTNIFSPKDKSISAWLDFYS